LTGTFKYSVSTATLRKTLPRGGSEHENQCALIAWAAAFSFYHPELALIFAVPNGALRNKSVAVNLQREGVKAGIPDLALPVARGGYHGMFIELKSGKNTLSESQKTWHAALRNQGYHVVTCWTWDDARVQILAYLQGEMA